jgi:hypothetical protein
MNSFDDHKLRGNEDFFYDQNTGPYGGLSISEVLQQPYLAEQYGLYQKQHDNVESIAEASVTNEFNVKALWYVFLAEAIAVLLILLFTFMF